MELLRNTDIKIDLDRVINYAVEYSRNCLTHIKSS